MWGDWTGQPAAIEVMKRLKASYVEDSYRARFWYIVKANDLNHGVNVFCFIVV